MIEEAGLRFELEVRQPWPGRVYERWTKREGRSAKERTAVDLTVEPWRDGEGRFLLLVRSVEPPGMGVQRSLMLGEVHRAACCRLVKSRGSGGPSYVRWRRRALIRAGLIAPAAVELWKLPSDAPEPARIFWGVVEDLVRAHRGPDDPPGETLPLSIPFLAEEWAFGWEGVDGNTLLAGQRWLAHPKRAYIARAGTVPSRGGGKDTILWRVAEHG